MHAVAGRKPANGRLAQLVRALMQISLVKGHVSKMKRFERRFEIKVIRKIVLIVELDTLGGGGSIPPSSTF